MNQIDEVLPAALDGQRLDQVVAAVACVSRAQATRLVRDGRVRLDGTVVTARSRRVTEGQWVVMGIPEPAGFCLTADPSVAFGVVFEDEHIAVIDKPAGLVVHHGAGRVDRPTLVAGLLDRYPEMADVGEPFRPGIVHRLDRDTSGLLVVARTTVAYRALVAQLAAHEPERVYSALVWGRPEAVNGIIDIPIGRSLRHRARMAATSEGRSAVTRYRVEHRYSRPRPVALLTCRLETGRTHQIRVHLQAIGHPVVGDRFYGGSRAGLDLRRPFLHAARLKFRHPVSDRQVGCEAPLPTDLVGALESCS